MTATVRGLGVVPGVGYGPVVRPADRPAEPGRQDPEATGRERFAQAAGRVGERLRTRAGRASGAAAEVLQATAGLADDRGLAGLVAQRLDRMGPAAATWEAVDELAALFRSAGGVMAERITDLFDVRDRIVAELAGLPEPGIPDPEVPSVLCADDLAPADTAGLDPQRVVAIVTARGGATSHTTIIARQLGIACIVGAAGIDRIAPGTAVLADADRGEVLVDPEPAIVADRTKRAEADLRRAEEWSGPGRTADGVAVDILANVHDGPSARGAAATPVAGVGLFRTELAFLDRAEEPSVTEQAELYGELLDAMEGRKVVIRTLDAGSDKPMAFVTLDDEPNPALGVRGLRLARRDEGLLTRQLDAIAKAAADRGTTPWVMAPMVAVESEAAAFAGLARARGLVPGVMVEVPAAAVRAERVLEHVDFVSIGTNDLSQYTFAADRMAAELADLTDPWQPALLDLIAQVGRAGREAGKPVGVCGEAAADPVLACVLVGLGVTSLSASATAVRRVGARLAGVTQAACAEAAAAARAATSAEQARVAALAHL